MSDDETKNLHPYDADEFGDRTVQVDRNLLMESVQGDSVPEDQRTTQRIPLPDHLRPGPVEDATIPVSVAQIESVSSQSQDKKTAKIELPNGLLRSLSEFPNPQTLEIHMEPLDATVDDGEAPEFSFVAEIQPDGTIRLPIELFETYRAKPGMRLQFLAFKA